MRLLYSTTIILALSASAQAGELCIDGHQAKRLPNCTHRLTTNCISYGGLSGKRGYQRDHYEPLELAGPDTVANIHYQRLEAAHLKDLDENRAGELMCRGIWPPEYARYRLAMKWPIDAEHGYDREDKRAEDLHEGVLAVWVEKILKWGHRE